MHTVYKYICQYLYTFDVWGFHCWLLLCEEKNIFWPKPTFLCLFTDEQEVKGIWCDFIGWRYGKAFDVTSHLKLVAE